MNVIQIIHATTSPSFKRLGLIAIVWRTTETIRGSYYWKMQRATSWVVQNVVPVFLRWLGNLDRTSQSLSLLIK